LPKTDNDDPRRVKLRSDIVDPKVRKSSKETADPIRAKLRSDSDDPKCT